MTKHLIQVTPLSARSQLIQMVKATETIIMTIKLAKMEIEETKTKILRSQTTRRMRRMTVL